MSLCYNPTANTITVNIIKARNLKAMDIGGTSGKELWLALVFPSFSPVWGPSRPTGSFSVLTFADPSGRSTGVVGLTGGGKVTLRQLPSPRYRCFLSRSFPCCISKMIFSLLAKYVSAQSGLL